ncbi:hypothetical protein SAMN05216378_1158 [Paenibacillus catalpae]|uniref:Uncharacterized protein n=1 Tax=Paenibacillus catalpae TaxID=1045775 RepID=A0A1I1UPI7_9BACL|nr:hypothetical protein SAMN05216378_1158 [Paenibacillus catalpae]
MEMIFFVIIVATNITLLQIKYFQKYKKLINSITAFVIVIWLLALIAYGINSRRAQTNLNDLKEDYPIYIIVFILAITLH